MLKSSLCDYNDLYILVKGTITVNNTAAADDDANNVNKKVIFKNCAPFTDCKSEINNVKIDNAKSIDIVMATHNLVEYSDNYSKTFGSVWQYHGDITAVNNNDEIADFGEGNLTELFNSKVKLLQQIKSDFKRTINWNKCTSKPELLR